MFRVIKKMFFVEMLFFSCNALRCISINNQVCKIRPEIILTVIILYFILTVLL